MRPSLRSLAGLLCALLLLLPAAAGCGLFSSEEEPLSGVYESNEFRIQNTAGETFNLGASGAQLEMTLTEHGRVMNGRLFVPADADGVDGPIDESFTGTYTRVDDQVRFDFDDGALSGDLGTGTPLADVSWLFFENDATLRADDDGYVLFLEKESAAPTNEEP